jgi:hypothetical protein
MVAARQRHERAAAGTACAAVERACHTCETTWHNPPHRGRDWIPEAELRPASEAQF